MPIIQRPYYLERLVAAKHNGAVKIVTGIRRCGKSFLLFKLFKEHLLDSGVSPDHILEVDLEQAELTLRHPSELRKHIEGRIVQDGKWTYVLIDEIQMCDKILRSDIDIKRLHPDYLDNAYLTFYSTLSGLKSIPMVDVYVTGSNSRMLISDVATEFRGRGDVVRVYPLSFAEFCQAREQISDLNAAIREYLMYGGLPECTLREGESAKMDYLRNLCQTIYLRDVEERHHIMNTALLEKVFDMAMSNIGGLTNPNKLANAISTSGGIAANNVTVSKFLDYLESAFIIEKARRYDVKGRHYLDSPVKYYACDTGIRNVHMNFRQYEPTHLMENAIYNELVRRGYSVDVGVNTISTTRKGIREKRQYEIDFVVNRFSERIYIQSAWMIPDEEKRKQETFSLEHTHDSFRKIVVTGDPYEKPWMDDNGITFMGIVPFLLDPHSLETL